MTEENRNLQMRDFAQQDPRSVSAMLRGAGDGREKPFLDFEKQAALVDPLLDDEEIGEFYRRQCREQEAQRCEAQTMVRNKRSALVQRILELKWKRIVGHLAMGTVVGIALLKATAFVGW